MEISNIGPTPQPGDDKKGEKTKRLPPSKIPSIFEKKDTKKLLKDIENLKNNKPKLLEELMDNIDTTKLPPASEETKNELRKRGIMKEALKKVCDELEGKPLEEP